MYTHHSRIKEIVNIDETEGKCFNYFKYLKKGMLMTICVYGCENGIKFVGDGKNQIPCKCADGQAAVFAKPGGGTFTGAEFHDDWKNNA